MRAALEAVAGTPNKMQKRLQSEPPKAAPKLQRRCGDPVPITNVGDLRSVASTSGATNDVADATADPGSARSSTTKQPTLSEPHSDVAGGNSSVEAGPCPAPGPLNGKQFLLNLKAPRHRKHVRD